MIHFRRVESITRHLRFYSTRTDKLRILFCGSDAFSIESLKALHDHSQISTQIESIDVVTRNDKRTGRGLKAITPPPIKKVATSLGLPLHQIDTFRGWTPPDINLIIAVSFGLLIPSRIINGSHFGGLNVHPSLLPDLRGAAPVQWAIMLGRQRTGVSVQTLHPTKFDEGIVLSQSGPVTIPDDATTASLTADLAPLGAKMLVNALKEELFLLPQAIETTGQTTDMAPRIKSEHQTCDFRLTRDEIVKRSNAVGPLHAFAEDAEGKMVRVKFGQICLDEMKHAQDFPIGVPWVNVQDGDDVMVCNDHLRVNTGDGVVCIKAITVEGKSPGPSAQRAAQAKLLQRKNSTVHHFKSALTI